MPVRWVDLLLCGNAVVPAVTAWPLVARFGKIGRDFLIPFRRDSHDGSLECPASRPASLYEAFPAAEARRLVERFEWHYTPKHGSWLDLAESELGVLAAQCLDRRIPDKQTIIDQVGAWTLKRNAAKAGADGRFARGGGSPSPHAPTFRLHARFAVPV